MNSWRPARPVSSGQGRLVGLAHCFGERVGTDGETWVEPTKCLFMVDDGPACRAFRVLRCLRLRDGGGRERFVPGIGIQVGFYACGADADEGAAGGIEK